MSSLAKGRCVVLLTFDFDAESAEMRKTSDLPVKISKGQYGPRVGLQRMLAFLHGRGIKSTFFIPAWTAERYEAQTRDIINRGHEGAGHGYLHENLSELTATEEWKVLRKSVGVLEEIIGMRPIGFRAPYWAWSKRTLGYLRKIGFSYDSSLMNDDKPYPMTEETGRELIYELPVEWFLDDWPLFELQRQSPSMVLETWRSEFNAVYSQNLVTSC